MTSNHKLTSLISGRKITSTSNTSDVMTIGFDDGSIMTVQTSGTVSAASSGTVEKVQQADTTLELVMEGGESLTIPLAEETSSVMVRDKDHGMEYAD